MNEYEDIINLPHYEPKHKRMSSYNRAAQFAPFAALTGYESAIKEKARLTTKEIEIDEDKKEEISNKLNNLDKNMEFLITYFVADNKKAGGKYITKKSKIKKIDFIYKYIKLFDNEKIEINKIIDIEIII